LKREGAQGRAYEIREAQGLMQTLREFERQLGKRAVALYTLVGPERFRVVLITADARIAAESPIGSAELNKRILAFRQVLEDPRVDPRPLAKELYGIILAPIAPALEEAKATTLMWSLDGALRYVAIPALHDGERYLAEKYESVVFTPASQNNLRDEPTPQWHGVGFGVSRAVAEFSPLPAVLDEMRGIFRQPGSADAPLEGRVLLDEQFTQAAFRTALREGLPVVHIATHFKFQPGNETDSFLLLGDGSRMTLAQLRDASSAFAGVELLALSACNTAIGGGDASGAEVEGFAVLAQRQGARAVLASLWAVADAGTRIFMEEFYRGRVFGDLSKAEALRRAQLALLRGTAYVAPAGADRGLEFPSGNRVFVAPTEAPYAHPYYWAPFMLIGNWK
jgi:CHAT domain-containing protein